MRQDGCRNKGVTNGLCDVLDVLSVDALMKLNEIDVCENMSVTNGLCCTLGYMLFAYTLWM